MLRRFTIVLICFGSAFSLLLGQLIPVKLKFTAFLHPAPGYFLLAPIAPDSLSLIDHSGKKIFTIESYNAHNFHFADSTVTHFVGDKRVYVRRNAHMAAIDTLRVSGGYLQDFHEGHMLKNGNYVVLAGESRTIDMTTLTPGGRSNAVVHGAVIQERTLNNETVFEWKSLDHIAVTAATDDVRLDQPTIDYIHVNAVNEDSDGNFLVSCRHLDEVIKINRVTGSIMWRLGGSKSKGNQFTFLNDNVNGFTGFSHQHDVFRTASGGIMMMDNGNLKPVPFSRAVEYEINETTKTARLIWTFRPTPDIFSSSKGSVQELSNGNIVVGWGQANSQILAHEVSRDGTIQAQFEGEDVRIGSYRVRKAVFAMSGTERIANTTGTYKFVTADSNTRISMVLTRVNAPTSIIAERHSLPPHNIEFTGAAPCVPLPMRWVIRVKDTSKIAGSTRFGIGLLPSVFPPSQAKLYHRSKEGEGSFKEVSTTFNATTGELVSAVVRPGEYALAYSACYEPKPAYPSDNAGSVSLSPTLVWTEALTTAGYEVELYLGSNPTPLHSFRTLRLDTVLTGLQPGLSYKWRVRARRDSANPWSELFTFRTRLDVPQLIAPVISADSIAVNPTPAFSWTASINATAYNLQVFLQGALVPTIDTVLQSTSYQWSREFERHTWYNWRVRALNDTNPSAWSPLSAFVTIPGAPQLLIPTAGAPDVDPDDVTISWATGTGANMYQVQVFKDVVQEPVFQDTVSELQARVPPLLPVTRYHWQIRSSSRYGVSEWTETQWFLTRGSGTLMAPVLLEPVSQQNIDTANSTLSWAPVEGASAYYVELTTKPTFATPDVAWFDVNSTTMTVPKLESGRLYLWRVLALSDVATSPWSMVAQFTTLPSPDDRLRPLTPLNGGQGVRIQSSATFVTDPRYTGYRAEFSTKSDFSNIAYAIGGSISPLPFLLSESTEYWWRVVGQRDGLDIDTGSSASFSTISPTSVSERAPTGPRPQIVKLGSEIEVRGDIGGCRVQVYDIVGRLVSISTIPPHVNVWQLPLTGLTGNTYAVVMVQPAGTIISSTILMTNSGW